MREGWKAGMSKSRAFGRLHPASVLDLPAFPHLAFAGPSSAGPEMAMGPLPAADAIVVQSTIGVQATLPEWAALPTLCVSGVAVSST